jgi:hypothetical protein
MVISNAVAAGAGAGQSADAAIAYVSAAPGTFPAGISLSVQNKTAAGDWRRIDVTDGGFDPVSIPARDGDELSFTVAMPAGQPGSLLVQVPKRRPPEVVRTNPVKGRTDVALRAQVQVVFSEPVDKLTLTASSMALFDNGSAENSVSASITVASDGLSVLVTPDAPLDPESNYTLGVTSAVHDLDGDAMANSTPLTFTTEAGPAPADAEGELVFVGLIDRQLYTVAVDGTNYRKLTSTGNNDHASWSPNGDLIAFARGQMEGESLSFGGAEMTAIIRFS